MNQNTLPSRKTELAGCFFHPETLNVFTVDVNCLVRCWCLKTGQCIKSYPLEIVSEHAQTGDLSAFRHRNKIQYVCVDPLTSNNLLVAF